MRHLRSHGRQLPLGLALLGSGIALGIASTVAVANALSDIVG